MIEVDLKAKHAKLRETFQATERDLDVSCSDELAEKFEAQFHELVALETLMAASGISC